jgi:hypothetical protein
MLGDVRQEYRQTDAYNIQYSLVYNLLIQSGLVKMFYGNTKTQKLRYDVSAITVLSAKLCV